MGTGKKTELACWWIVALAMAVGTVYMYMEGKETKGLMGILTCLCLAAIGLWQWKSRHAVHSGFMSMTYLFIFISVGLGTFGGAYSIPHFDDFLHVSSGIWLGYGAWILLLKMVGGHVADQLPKAFIALFIILFAMASAGVWELLEFAGDKLLHFTAQGRDPDDTMFDMIDGLIGGIIAATWIITRKKDK